MTGLHFTIPSPLTIKMASTQPLSYRLKVMEARLNCMTDTIEQLRGRIHNLDVAVSNSVAIQTRFLSMLEQLQPLGEFTAAVPQK